MAVSNYELSAVIKARDEFTGTFNKVMGTAEEGVKRVNKQTEFFHGNITAVAAKFSILEHAIRRVVAIGEELATPYKIVEDFNLSIIRMAALYTGLAEKPGPGKTLADQYAQAKDYANDLVKALEKLVPTTFGGLSELMLITEEMAKQGVMLDLNNQKQMMAFRNIANAVNTIAAGYQNREVQIRQEARSLMEGVVRPTNQLAMQIDAMVGGNLKEMVENWKRQGVLVEKIGDLLKGYDQASGDISKTWAAIKTTIETTFQVALRNAFMEAYGEINAGLIRMNKYIQDHADQITGFVKGAWIGVKNTVKAVQELYAEFDPIIKLMTGGMSPGMALAKSFLYLTNAVMPEVIRMIRSQFAIIIDTFRLLYEVGSSTWEVITNPSIESIKKAGAKIADAAIQIGKDVWHGMIPDTEFIKREILKVDQLLEGPVVKAITAKTKSNFGLRPEPPDPKDVDAWKKWKEQLEDTMTKMEDKDWGEWWNKYRDGLEKVTKAQGDMNEFWNMMARLGDDTLGKIEKRRIETDIRMIEADREAYGNAELLITKKAELMRNQGKSEVEIAQFTSNATTELAREDFKKWFKGEEQKKNEAIRLAKKTVSEQTELFKSQIEERERQRKENAEAEKQITEGAISEYDKMQSYLLDNSGKYYTELAAMRRQDAQLEAEEMKIKYAGRVEAGLIDEYYAEKVRRTELELRALRIKNSDDMVEAWRVAYGKMKQDQYSWGQFAYDSFQGLTKSMEQTLGDFFYDAWRGQLKDAKEYFQSFANSMVRTFADAVGKMITQWLILKAIQTGASIASAYFGSGWGTAGAGGGDYQVYEAPTKHQGGPIKMHSGGDVPIIAQVGEYMVRRSSVNANTLPALESINNSGRADEGNQQPVSITINAVDSESFVQLLHRNRNALSPLMSDLYRNNTDFRRTLRGQA